MICQIWQVLHLCGTCLGVCEKAIDNRNSSIVSVCTGWVVFAWPECRHADRVGRKVRVQGHGSTPVGRSVWDGNVGRRKRTWAEHTSADLTGTETAISNRSRSLDFVAGMADSLGRTHRKNPRPWAPIYFSSGNPISGRKPKDLGNHTRGLSRIWHRACPPTRSTALVRCFRGHQSGCVPVLDNTWPSAFGCFAFRECLACFHDRDGRSHGKHGLFDICLNRCFRSPHDEGIGDLGSR